MSVSNDIPLAAVVPAALVHELVLCAFMTVLIVASLRQNPLIWLDDAPPDVRARFGPIDARTRVQKRVWGAIAMVGLALIFGRLASEVWAYGLLATFLASYICFQLFNLYDAVVIDLGLVLVRPAWAFPPGAAHAPSYRDVRWHVRNWLIGVIAGVPFAGIVVAVGWLLNAVVL